MLADAVDPFLVLPGLLAARRGGLDPGEQARPARGVGQVVGPQVATDEDAVPGGRLADDLVDGQLIGVVRSMELLEGPPEHRLGLGQQGSAAPARPGGLTSGTSRAASATAS